MDIMMICGCIVYGIMFATIAMMIMIVLTTIFEEGTNEVIDYVRKLVFTTNEEDY